MPKTLCLAIFLFLSGFSTLAQTTDSAAVAPVDSMQAFHPDSTLRIINLNPFFTLHVDSSLTYQLEINKNPEQYFWYLKNSPVGLRINKDNGQLSFKADKSYFLSGRLKYDINYKVLIGVQNLSNPLEKVDTSFTIVFFNTEIIPSKVKPTVNGTIWADEGEPLSFRVLCETGSFPIENIQTLTSVPIKNYVPVQKCGEEFQWTPGYDIARETDKDRIKEVQLYFVGITKSGIRDTNTVRLYVRDALNYPVTVQEYRQAVRNTESYILKLKYTFLILDKRLKKTRSTRTGFDLTAASTSLTGTILSTNARPETSEARMGKILPSVGLALVPIKEAAAPSKAVDQNQATLVRTNIKRLEYGLTDNQLIGEKDPDIMRKLNKIKEELKQVQVQLIDVPIELTNDLSEEELNRYFNSPKVMKKYRLKR